MHPTLPTRTPRRRLAGFTLIELLTVIAIIGILAAIIIPTVGKVRQMARKSTATSDLRQVGLALISFAQEHRQTLPGPSSLGITSVYTRLSNANELAASLAPYFGMPARDSVPYGETKIAQPLVCPGFLQHQPEISASLPPHYIQNYTIPGVPGNRIFGRYASGSLEEAKGLKMSKLEELGGASRVWALTNLDQQLPQDNAAMNSNQITGSGWFSGLPPQPVWGSSRLRVYLDGHVASVSRNADP